jgi:hypothetical protein
MTLRAEFPSIVLVRMLEVIHSLTLCVRSLSPTMIVIRMSHSSNADSWTHLLTRPNTSNVRPDMTTAEESADYNVFANLP